MYLVMEPICAAKCCALTALGGVELGISKMPCRRDKCNCEYNSEFCPYNGAKTHHLRRPAKGVVASMAMAPGGKADCSCWAAMHSLLLSEIYKTDKYPSVYV